MWKTAFGLVEEEEYAFPDSWSSNQREVIHCLATQNGVCHETRGKHSRQLVLLKKCSDDLPQSSQSKNAHIENSTTDWLNSKTKEEALLSLFDHPVNLKAIMNFDISIQRSMLLKDPNAISDVFLNEIIFAGHTVEVFKALFESNAYEEL